MFAEVVLTSDDLRKALSKAFPLTIHLGDEGKEELKLFDLEEVNVPTTVGLHTICKAEVIWPVLGIEVPVVLRELNVDFKPVIGKGPDGDTLEFKIHIEHADIKALPTFMDNTITDIVNKALEAKNIELVWDFSKSLTLALPLPTKIVEPLERFALKPAWGKIRIDEDCIVLAVSFDFDILRVGQAVPPELRLNDGTTAVSA